MPRCARVKSFDSVYHIMCRSISDIPLFRSNSDKDKYLGLIKKYQTIYLFKVYAYCIMNTHVHMAIDAAGADISKVMHGINQCYAQYFNRKYKRHGHVFQDRFKSKIIYEDRGLLNVSSYIHNNPSDINKYRGREQHYKYSSLGIYLGIREDTFRIVDANFLLSQVNQDIILARKDYMEFVHQNKEDKDEDVEFRHERAEYRSERRIIVRKKRTDDVIDFVAVRTDQSKTAINIKYSKKAVEFRALVALLLRGVCDMCQKEICKEMGNITQAQASKLCRRGLMLIYEREEYRRIISDFINLKIS